MQPRPPETPGLARLLAIDFLVLAGLILAINPNVTSGLRSAPRSAPRLSLIHISIRLLPVGMLVSQVLMQKMTPSTTTDPSQKTMMMVMPVVLSVMFYSAPSGLVLYLSLIHI